MAEWKLANGTTITDEEIECECAEYEAGTWEGHLTNYRRGPGRPPLASEPNASLSFKCPRSDADLIAEAARACGMKKSAFIRGAALEKAEDVLTSGKGEKGRGSSPLAAAV